MSGHVWVVDDTAGNLTDPDTFTPNDPQGYVYCEQCLEPKGTTTPCRGDLNMP